MTVVKTFPWVGGKAKLHGWVRSHLPNDAETYVEPFAGALSVLLNRAPAEREFAFDLDPDVVGFWRAVQADPQTVAELYESIEAWADKESWQACVRSVKAGPPGEIGCPVRAAMWVSAVVCSFGCKLGHGWIGDAGGSAVESMPRLHHRFGPMSERVQGVRFAVADACDVIAAAGSECVVYADPPYLKTHKANNYYRVGDFDHDAFDAACLSSEARVAVSGYPGDRDELEAAGWRFEDKPYAAHLKKTVEEERPKRVERMWFNYGEAAEEVN